MKNTVNKEHIAAEVVNIYNPNVTLVISLHQQGAANRARLEDVVNRIEKELLEIYDPSNVTPIVSKLRHIAATVNYDSPKQSLAVFVSPLFEKVYYLDIPIEEKISIDEPIEIRDLIYGKKPENYLVLLLSAKQFHLLLGDHNHVARLKVSIPDHIDAYETELPDRVANFSDPNQVKENLLDKFVQSIDQELQSIRQTYPLNIFVLGTERTVGHFKKFSRNKNHVVEYIFGNYDDASEAEIYKILNPHLSILQEIKNRELMNEIEQAGGANKLTFGINEVWRYAMENRGRLLIVEKGYTYPEPTNESGERAPNPSFLKDAVDVIIEKVIETGGDIAFVDPGVLADYERIALLQYY